MKRVLFLLALLAICLSANADWRRGGARRGGGRNTIAPGNGGGVDAVYSNTHYFTPNGSDEFINIGDSASLDADLDNRSVCLWVRDDIYAAGDPFVTKSDASQRNFSLRVHSTTDHAIQACLLSLGSSSCAISTSGPAGGLVDGTPYFICMVYDGTQGVMADRGTLYQDAALLAETLVGTIPTTFGDGTAPVRIASDGAGTLFGTGWVDEVTYWSTSLTQAQVNTLCCGSAASCPSGCSFHARHDSLGISGLVSYWRMDGDTHPTATDSVGANPGTYTNTESTDIAAIPSNYDHHDRVSATFDGVDEFMTAADHEAYECDTEDQATWLYVFNVTTCGASCDDNVGSKGTNTTHTMGLLAEQRAGGFWARVTIGLIGNFAQVGSSLVLSRWTNLVWTYDGAQVDGGDAGSDANDERLDIFAEQCDTSTPPVCPALATDLTSGLGACGTAPCFLGTIGSTLRNDATPFLIGGFDGVGGFNFAGAIAEVAMFCNGKVTATQVNDCLLTSTRRVADLNTLSSRSSGGTACNVIFSEPRAWFRMGDLDAFGTLNNRFASGGGNGTETNMEIADHALHTLGD